MTIKSVSINTDLNPAVAELQNQFANLIKDVFGAVGASGAVTGKSWVHAGSSDAVVFPANATDLASSLLLGNSLRAAHIAHYSNLDPHKIADVTNVTASPVATDLTSLQTLLNEIKTDFNAHIASTTYHAVADGTNTIATANASDQATSNALANQIKTSFNAHTALGMTCGAVRATGL